MSLGHRTRRPSPIELCVAVAVLVAAARGAVAEETRGFIVPEPAPRFAGLPANPLIEMFVSSQARLRAIKGGGGTLGAFPRLADAPPAPAAPRLGEADAPAPLAPPDSVPPDPVPTAIANALARFIVHEDPTNPLGEGDWRAAKAAIGAYYASRGFQPVWVDPDGLTRAGRAAAAQIARAPEDGLSLSGFAPPGELRAPLDLDALGAAEVAVSAAVVVYAEQATGSRLLPSRISPIFAGRPEVADPGAALAETVAAADPGARLAAFNPPQKGYRALREALNRLDDSAEAGPRRQKPAALDIGEAAANAPDFGEGPLPGAAGKDEPAAAGRRAYVASAAGDPPHGATARRRAAILANMEMWRWEPRDMGVRRVEVNIPDYSVVVVDSDSVLMSSRVVVGKPTTPTPVFSEPMRYVLINPAWQVPDSIIRKEILPRLEHFTELGYQVKTVGGRVVVRQPPGEDNALGRLAFMFPNDHSVYLHDTPARRLFAQAMRALSHGCVRVEDPKRLAELVLGWPESRVAAAIGGPERAVFLPQPLPVHIEYFTEFVGDDGTLEERADVYGLAQRVARTLAREGQD